MIRHNYLAEGESQSRNEVGKERESTCRGSVKGSVKEIDEQRLKGRQVQGKKLDERKEK